jgi:hypothetical protein
MASGAIPTSTGIGECPTTRQEALLGARTCNSRRGAQVFDTKPARRKTCTCGEPLPRLEKYAITFVFEKVADYRLGQCRRCATMFWEEG